LLIAELTKLRARVSTSTPIRITWKEIG
jgi:hypothetical protein